MNKKSLTLVILLFIGMSTFAQTENDNNTITSQEVTVYNEFTPTISDAFRIQYLPTINDTIVTHPDFEYSINSVPHPVKYTPTSLQAAELKGEPLKPLNNGLVTIGIGSNLTPYASVYYHSKRQKNFQIGAIASHFSSHGKLKNYEDRKIYSGFNDNNILLYGKKFIKGATLHSDINFKSQQNFFYGYRIDSGINIPSDYIKPVLKDEMEMQRFNCISINAGILSNNNFDKNLNYDISIDYNYLFTVKDYNQNYFAANLDINKNFKKLNNGGLDGSYKLYKTNLITNSTSLLNLNPYIKRTTQNWQIKLGINTTGKFVSDSVKYNFYPNVLIQHNIGNTLIPYFSFKGNMQINDVATIGWENPYTIDSLTVTPTNYAQVIDLGMKGSFNKKVYFHINANYSKIDNMYFFVVDTSNIERNKFDVTYSNVERFSGYGELRITPNEQFDIILNGHYYYYHYIKSEEKPWQKPNFDASLGARYHFDNKLSFGANLTLIGTRFAKTWELEPEKLKPYFEANLSADYQIASNFNAFIHINNIAAQKYYMWQNYPVQRFNVMLGINYAF
jgi:hypothetical protein